MVKLNDSSGQKRAFVRFLGFVAVTFLLTWGTGMLVVLSNHANTAARSNLTYFPMRKCGN